MSSNSSDRYRSRFSQRYGYKEIPEPVKPGEISDRARNRIWDKLYEAVPFAWENKSLSQDFPDPHKVVDGPWYDILKYLHTEFFELTLDEFSASYGLFFREYKDLICGSENALPPEELLDLIEYIIAHPTCPPEFIDDMEETFRECHLPYGVNKTPSASIYVAEDEATRKLALEPALAVLAEPRFEVASEEFRSAMNDYRSGNYANCLANCGSSFESVLKVICRSNGWSSSKTATAGQLIRTVVEKSSLDSFFKEPLALIATMRNHLSNVHGGGDEFRAPQRHIARYAVSSTASAIVLIASAVDGLEFAGEPGDE